MNYLFKTPWIKNESLHFSHISDPLWWSTEARLQKNAYGSKHGSYLTRYTENSKICVKVFFNLVKPEGTASCDVLGLSNSWIIRGISNGVSQQQDVGFAVGLILSPGCLRGFLSPWCLQNLCTYINYSHRKCLCFSKPHIYKCKLFHFQFHLTNTKLTWTHTNIGK